MNPIIFDMDGLLADSEPLWQRAELAMIEARGEQWNDEIMHRQIGMAMPEACAQIVADYGFDDDPTDFELELKGRMMSLFRTELEPMPGARELMDAALASERPVAVATSSPWVIAEIVLGKFGWLEQLDAIVTGDDPAVTRGKPAPDIFLLAAARLGAAPANCAVLEDSVNGARGARNAGMTVVAVPNVVYHVEQFSGIADRVVPSLTALTIDDLQPNEIH